jgi:acyl-CoA synthetase (AMP-forming)/AMP-acid ligase II
MAGATRSYGELDRIASRVAAALVHAGAADGQRVALLSKDRLETFDLLFGCAKAGAVWLGLNWRLTADELAFILEDAEAKLLFVSADYRELGAELSRRVPAIEAVVCLDDPGLDAWCGDGADANTGHRASRDDCIVQMYTSGTTGNPKGVRLAHRSFFAVVRGMQAANDPWIGFGPRDVSLLAIPAFHIGGMWWAMTTLVYGARCEILPQFAGRDVLAAVQREGVTKTCLVPAMIQVCLGEPTLPQTDLGSLDCIVYGGSPIPRTLLSAGRAAFGCRFAQIYGLTETGNTAVCLRPEDHEDETSERLAAAGRAYPTVELAIVDEQGRELPPRAAGQILIRSPANMLGYWNRPEATAETLRDGWIWTGDGGFLDEQGYVYVQDRLKDMILYAGENVYPAEIESVLCAHPAVLEAAVIGVPDERWGELVKAICVLREGHAATPAQLLAHCRGKLADFKLPRSIDFSGGLPRTPSGKIKKAELRAPYWEGRERQVN